MAVKTIKVKNLYNFMEIVYILSIGYFKIIEWQQNYTLLIYKQSYIGYLLLFISGLLIYVPVSFRDIPKNIYLCGIFIPCNP